MARVLIQPASGILRSALARFGFSRALTYSILGRTWSLAAGAVSLLFVGWFLSLEEQGFYYTFWSVLGVWVFFDLGLSVVVVHFTSHERAELRREGGVMVGAARAKTRLASLLHLAVRWYTVAGVLMFIVVLPVGLIFFRRYEPAGSTLQWLFPWVLVAVTSTMNLLIGPFAALLEGAGLIEDIALMRLIQAIVANAILWIALAGGAGLYAAVALNGSMALFNVVWIISRHGRLLLDLWRTPAADHRISWRTEIWPFQWRFAVSWMTGYFMFQIFTPLLFAVHGPDAAARMGMSLMVTTAIYLFSQTWITTAAVDFGSLIASGDFAQLDHRFKRSLIQSTIAIVFLSSVFFLIIEAARSYRHPFAARLLDTLPLALLLLAMVLNHIVSAEAAYLRAFKREPFLGVFGVMAGVTAALSVAVVRPFGATGMMFALFATVLLVGLVGGSVIFSQRRREWRTITGS